jgi:hypothetical protein
MATEVRGGGVLVLAMGAAVLCLGPSEIAFAATTFTVNSTASTPDAVPGDGICDDGTGACTLPAAVGEAASAPTCLDPVEIHFSVSGQIDAGIEYHVAAGSPCANPSLSIIGPGADCLILSGGVSASGYAYDYPPDYFSPVKTFLGLQGVHVSGELHFNEAAASLADLIADGGKRFPQHHGFVRRSHFEQWLWTGPRPGLWKHHSGRQHDGPHFES